MKKIIYSTLLIIVAFLLSYMFINNNKKRTHINTAILRVGTSPDYPPYASLDEKGEIVGFDIDVAREVANRLHKKLILFDRPFTALIFELLGGHIDVIAAGMSPTKKRAERVQFSDTYLDGDCLVCLTKENIQQESLSPSDFKHKKIVVNTGYTSDSYISEFPELDVIRLQSPAQAILAVTSGSADIFLAAKSSVIPFLEKHPHALHVRPVEDTDDSYALVLRKNSPLAQPINHALAAMKKDGTITKLKEKWGLCS